MLTSWDHLHGVPGEKPDSEVKEAAGSWPVVSSLDRLDMGNSENTELWPCFGVGCVFTWNQESRQGYKPDSLGRGLQWGCRTSQAIWQEEKEGLQIVLKKYVGKKVAVKTAKAVLCIVGFWEINIFYSMYFQIFYNKHVFLEWGK